jgi:hypothetical protein
VDEEALEPVVPGRWHQADVSTVRDNRRAFPWQSRKSGPTSVHYGGLSMNELVPPKPPWTVAQPAEVPDAELEAMFRKTVDDVIAWATTEGKRDQVMNALHDVMVGLGPDDGTDQPL